MKYGEKGMKDNEFEWKSWMPIVTFPFPLGLSPLKDFFISSEWRHHTAQTPQRQYGVSSARFAKAQALSPSPNPESLLRHLLALGKRGLPVFKIMF